MAYVLPHYRSNSSSRQLSFHMLQNGAIYFIKPLKLIVVKCFNLNFKVAVASNTQTLQKLPHIEGLLSYRADNRKLYLRGKDHWNMIANDGEVRRMAYC